MNPEQPSREQIETRITALLLGELPEDEAQLLRWTISQDAALKKLHDELQAAIALVREAEKNLAEPATENPISLKLSSDRREKLLAHFKTPRPETKPAKELFWLKPIDMSRIHAPRLLVALAVLAIVATLAAMLLPALSKAKSRAMHLTVISGKQPKDLAYRTWSEEKREPPQSVAAAPITVVPQPVLAPPLAQIVLPKTEQPSSDALVNDGKLLYELGKLDDASAKFKEALKENPNNRAANYYQNLNEQTRFAQQSASHQAETQTRLASVEKQWAQPALGIKTLPSIDSAPSSPVAEAEPQVGSLSENFVAGAGGGGGDVYVIKPGDTLSKIARDHGTTVEALEEANNLSSSKILAGAKMKLPVEPEIVVPDIVPVATTPDAGTTFGQRQPDVNYQAGLAVSTVRSPAVLPPPASPVPPKSAFGPPGGTFALDTVDQSNGDTLALNGVDDWSVQPANQTATNALPAAQASSAGALVTVGGSNLQRVDLNSGSLVSVNDRTYEDVRRQLGQMRERHQLLYSKIEAEKLNMELPKSSPVQIVDAAEPTRNRSLWQSLNGEYESKARIKIESNVSDISINGKMTTATMTYDPYFIQTTFEVMQSDAVLGKVVDSLKLQDLWSKDNGGRKLTRAEAVAQLKSQLELKPVKNTKLIEIGVTSDNPEEAAKIANAVAKAYVDYRVEIHRQTNAKGIEVLEQQYLQESNRIQQIQTKMDKLAPKADEQSDKPLPKPALNAPVPQPEFLTRENAFSTFSLNISDVSFKLAEASLAKGLLPEPASIRSEEFINAFNYRDPEATPGQPLAFAAERACDPFAHNRDLLRFSIKTAAAGRQAGRALNLVLLLDNSGSMERADRVAIIRESLRVLATQLHVQDKVSVVTFSRTARLWADGVSGDQAGETLKRVSDITPEGGTNLEEAMRLAYETARRHYLASGMNRVVLLTDGAANLGEVDPAVLEQMVEANRKQGIALDCFGIGWEDYNDDLLEQLSSNGDGRYAFLDSPQDAAGEFAAKLAGALQVAAQDVKVQVEFNPQRVAAWRQIGYAKHQLTKEQFRDNMVDAGEIAAQEAGNALYTIQVKPDGSGPIATVRVRYRVPGTQDYRERSWDVPYNGTAPALEQSSAAMRLAGVAGEFSEWLAESSFAQEVTLDDLQHIMAGVPKVYGADQRPKQLEVMIREAKSLSGK